MNLEALRNAELERWNDLEVKVNEAIELSKGLRYCGPHEILKDALKNIRGFRGMAKALHDSMRKQEWISIEL